MKKLILILILASLGFSLGVLADETIRPNGWSWQKISDARRLGYVEGFSDGQTESMLEARCEEKTLKALQATGACILHKLWLDTLIGTDADKTLDIMVKFYAVPQNLPVRWGHAVIISGAIVSGVPVEDKDLQVIRQEDAKVPSK